MGGLIVRTVDTSIMPSDGSRSAPTSDDDRTAHVRIAAVAFVAAAVPFLLGGAITIRADPPPSTAPALGMASHALWLVAVVILAVGAVSLLRGSAAFRRGIAGYLAVGAFGLGVVHALQWVTWAYVDVRAARGEEYDLLVDALIAPFGAGHALTYGVLVGSGVALLGWGVVRNGPDTRLVGWIGTLTGSVALVTAMASLLTVAEGGGDGTLLYNVAILSLPACYLWALLVGLVLYRRG